MNKLLLSNYNSGIKMSEKHLLKNTSLSGGCNHTNNVIAPWTMEKVKLWTIIVAAIPTLDNRTED